MYIERICILAAKLTFFFSISYSSFPFLHHNSIALSSFFFPSFYVMFIFLFVFPILPTLPTPPTLPTMPTSPTPPTLPTFPTMPTFPTLPTMPTPPTLPIIVYPPPNHPQPLTSVKYCHFSATSLAGMEISQYLCTRFRKNTGGKQERVL